MAEDPANPDHVIAGTGEDNGGCADCYFGMGILSSTDGGTTWTAQDPTYESTLATSYATTTATDSSAKWATNQWAGATVSVNSNVATVASNTATTLTLANPWSGGPPVAGTGFTIALFDGMHIASVAIAPGKANDMFAATDKGLFVTTDGGTTWAPGDASYTGVDGASTAVTSVVVVAPATVYVGGGTAGVAKSTDLGVTWAPANAGLLTGSPTCDSTTPALVSLAVATPTTIYASLGNRTKAVALCRTTNGGASWSAVSAPDYTGNAYAYGSGCPPNCEQGWYDNVVAVDPANANHVLAGGETVVESTNAGGAWTNVNGQTFFGSGTNRLHPDQHALAFRPDGKIWIGNDGGLYLYDPVAGAVTNANANPNGDQGLNITQFYAGFTGVDGFVLAGAQDNANVLLESPIRPPTIPWFSSGIYQGDGGATAVLAKDDPSCLCLVELIESDKNLAYSTNDWGIVSSSRCCNTINNITPGPTSPQVVNAPFVPPLLALPNPADWANPTIFYGGQGLYRDLGASPSTWTVVAGSFTSPANTAFTATSATDKSNPNWTAGQWAGFTVTDGANSAIVASNTANALTLVSGWSPKTPAVNSVFSMQDTVSAIAVAPTNAQVIYVGYQDGIIQVSTDGGATFISLGTQPFIDRWVTGISVDPTNPKAITASFTSNFVRSQLTGALPHVGQYSYTTTPGTGAWTVITGNLPAQAAVSHVIYDNGTLVAATDTGVYGTVSPAGASTVWSLIGSGLPRVQVQDAAADPATNDLLIVTHGRGAWKLVGYPALAWGENGNGELGNATQNPHSAVPTLVSGLQGVTAVAAGGSQGLAVANGAAWAWGINGNGQLGNGTTTNSDVPVAVCAPGQGGTLPCPTSLSGVKTVAAGKNHSLALMNNGTVLAWGLNNLGQLGNGTTTDSPVPVPVPVKGVGGVGVLSGVAAIAAGGSDHNLALLKNGTIVAWGSNTEGELGNGTTSTDSTVPVAVSLPPGATATAVAGGGSGGVPHSLALLSTGTVLAWGDDRYGELGNGTLTGYIDTPTAVCAAAATAPCGTNLLSGVTAISAGGAFSLALLKNGKVMAWGINNYGQLGDGTTAGPINNCSGSFGVPCDDQPAAVCAAGANAPCGTKTLRGVTAIAAGYLHTLAIVTNTTGRDTLLAWGADDQGQLGNGIITLNPTDAPVSVCSSAICPPLLSGALAIAAGLAWSVAAVQ
jgi:alpha-tubulin suppressor-like RCC1 family protein